jgi:hypothetical protein
MERRECLLFVGFLAALSISWLVVSLTATFLVTLITGLDGDAAYRTVSLAMTMPIIFGFVIWGLWTTRPNKHTSY